ncbi:Hypothetical protein A7982_10819 [Minicystis rosea]|nr:Hypothetical protein A7982_10819 [Minicystis rosea]
MNDPTKKPGDDPRLPIPGRTGDQPEQGVPSRPRPEIPSVSPRPEIPAKPSRDVPQPDRERAENEGMIDKRPPVSGKVRKRAARP